MDFEGEFIDEDLLVEIPCEVCGRPFPLISLLGHQEAHILGLVDENGDEVNFVDNPIFEAEVEEGKEEDPPVNGRKDPSIKENREQPAKKTPGLNQNTLQKEEKQKSTKNVTHDFSDKKAFNYDEVLEEDILQENENTFTFGSASKEKRVEEEKPTFKVPPAPILNNNDSKYLIHNDLPDSDNEEGESLEEFWRKADIKLAQIKRVKENETKQKCLA